MKAAVVGSGAWGTALAVRLCKNGHDVTMWTYEKDKIPEMLETHHNPRLPAAVLPETLKISGDYDCVRGCKLVVMASPSFPLRAVSRGVAPYIDDDAVVVSVTKGLEQNTHLRMSQVVAQETGKNVVALTGPSHAEEVCINLPTGLLAASTDQALAEFVQDAFMADTLRVYTSPDPVGAELGAALAEGDRSWLLIPLAALLGWFIISAEPAVGVLEKQIEDVSAGAIPGKTIKVSLSVAIALAMAFSMLRVVTGISLLWFIVPGYALALILSFFVPDIYTAIAFDSGGVASGPMTATFMLQFMMGTSIALGGDVLCDAFGVVALVAMMPLLSIQAVGFYYEHIAKRPQEEADVYGDYDIIELWEASA